MFLCVLHTVLMLERQLMNKTKPLVQRAEARRRQIKDYETIVLGATVEVC